MPDEYPETLDNGSNIKKNILNNYCVLFRRVLSNFAMIPDFLEKSFE